MSLFNLFKKIQPEHPKQKVNFDSTFFNMKIKDLPQNFAQKVMDLQMKLQFADSYELTTIRELNDLYKLAIEYYIHQDCKKANHFQRKLTKLLSNKQTLDVIEKNSSSPNQDKVKLEQEYHKQLNNQLGNFNIQSNVVVQQLIVSSHRKLQQNNRLINQELDSQQNLLLNRIERRSKSKNGRKYFSP